MKLSSVRLGALLLGAAACASGSAGEGQAPTARTIHTVDGVALATFTVGRAHRDTLVVPMASLVMASLRSLGDGRTVIFYDIRGRGRSTGASDTAISLARDVQDLESVRAAFGLGRMHLLGWSYSGAVVANYALEHPGRVERVVLLSPIAPSAESYGASPPPVGSDTAAQAQLAALERSGRMASQPVEHCRLANRIEIAELVADSSARQRRTDVCDLSNEWPPNLMRTTMARLGKLGSYNWRDRLAAARLPLFVIAGTRDFIPLGAAKAWVAGDDERIVVIPNAGHYAFLEEPNAVLAAIERLLGD